MRKNKYIFPIVLWGIVLVFLVAILINGTLYRKMPSFLIFSSFKNSEIKSTSLKYTNEYEIDILDSENIEFDLTVDEIILEYYEGNTIKITEKSNYELEKNEMLQIDRKSNSLIISRDDEKFNVSRNNINRLLQIYLPREYNGKLEVSNNVGDININSELILDELNIKQNVGDLNISAIDTNIYKIENNVGDIEIEDISGCGEIRSDVGNIKCGIDLIKGDIKINANTGDIKVSVDSNISFNLEVNYGIGDFKSNLQLNNCSQRDKEVKGSYGNNPKYELELKANIGDIKVNEN